MTRNIAASILSKLTADAVYPFYAIDFNFDDNPVYAWTGLGTITIGGNDYIGTGTLLQISDVEETQDIAAKGMTLSLTGVLPEFLALALTEPYQGRICTVYLGFMTSWESPDASPDVMEMFSGYMDQMTIDEGAETATIALSVENRLIDLQRPRNRRYTKQNQDARFSGDKAFNYVESLQEKKLIWGKR